MHPIITSIEEDNFEEFKRLINEDPSCINELDNDQWPLLSLATQYEMPEFVEFLLEKMTPEQIQAVSFPIPPIQIAFENQSNIVDIFVNHPKIDLHSLFKSDETLLFFAVHYKRDDLIPYLIENELSPFAKNKSGETPILKSIVQGNNEQFEMFSQHLDFVENYSEDWIKMAIRYNRVEIFKRLQPHSQLSIDELFNNAIGFEHIEIVESILNSGDLIPGTKQITGLIDLMCAKYESKNEKEAADAIADFLFASKIPFNQFINESGDSAWKLAVYNDNEEIFEKLISTNETVNIVDNYQYTPLFYAIEKRNLKFVNAVLQKKANVNHVDKNKSTPLIQAVRYGLKDVVDRLLEIPNIGINEKNNNNETALSIALHQKRMDIVSSLIWRGAEITKNPTKFIEDNSVYQIGLTGNYEKAFEDYSEKEINDFIALTQLGFNLNEKNENGDTLLQHFIKHGYLANFTALLKCVIRDAELDADGNNALMCAMKKDNDDYSLGLLRHCRNIDYSIINNDGENIYDLASDCNSARRVIQLINKDPDLKTKNIEKVLPIILLSGNIQELKEIVEDKLPNLSTFIDKNGNNPLMLSIINNNFDNFTHLLKELKVNQKHVNSKGENIFDIIKKLPEYEREKYNFEIKPYLNQLKNK